MAGKLSPAAQVRLSELAGLLERVHRVHSLVEQYATARDTGERFLLPLARAFNQLKLYFSGAGFDAMSQLAGSMEIAARRGMSRVSKVRVLRDGIGSLRFQVELAQRTIISEERAAAEKKAGAEPDDAGDAAAEP